MTDDQIIKALECCCFSGDCDQCPYEDMGESCKFESTKDALDLIKKQKAEIDKLKENNKEIMKTIAGVHTEAIKEFAERYAENFIVLFNLNYGQTEAARELRKRIVKEMCGDDND